ncbi:MAG TPA: hypothetical protein VFI10_05035, partial [Gaiellaceae bacterium]|nr:hypothetical protein [Gaiellaceae bacterium]
MIAFGDGHTLTPVAHGRRVDLDRLLSLSLLAALDTTGGVDETLAVGEPQVDGARVVIERESTLWERAWLELRPVDGALELHTVVSGRGDLTTVRLLGGRSLI